MAIGTVINIFFGWCVFFCTLFVFVNNKNYIQKNEFFSAEKEKSVNSHMLARRAPQVVLTKITASFVCFVLFV